MRCAASCPSAVFLSHVITALLVHHVPLRPYAVRSVESAEADATAAMRLWNQERVCLAASCVYPFAEHCAEACGIEP